MSLIISKRFYQRSASGEPISYRTKYYHHFDGERGRPVAGSKSDAVHMDGALAAQVCRQLNQIAGTGWVVVSPDATPERDKRPPKAAPAQASA